MDLLINQIIHFWSWFCLVVPILSWWISGYGIPWWNQTISYRQGILATAIFPQLALWIPVLFYYVFPSTLQRTSEQKKHISLKKLIFWALFNHLFLSSAYGFAALTENGNLFEIRDKTSTSFRWTMVQFLICVLLEDFCFYFLHRLAHYDANLYQFHKWHHEVVHPTALTTFYVHPLEHMIINVFPIMLGPFLLKPHPLFTLIWITLSVLLAVHNHSGTNYWFLPSVFFHDLHHHDPTKNFGVSGVFDYLFR